MRITGGHARGIQLQLPRRGELRPATDALRAAVFSSLAQRIPGARVLDLFAGTGNLGIEALSRGASFAVFVDSHRDSAETIRKNLEITRFTGQAKVVVQEATGAIQWLSRGEAPFHLVFLDPPYHEGLTQSTLEVLAASPLIDSGSTVVAEFSSKEEVPSGFGRLQETERRVYGDTALSFLTITDRGESCP